jgi:type I site-specific restriction endonuclease
MALSLKEILAAKAAQSSTIKPDPEAAPAQPQAAPVPSAPTVKETAKAAVEIEAIKSRMDKAILSEAEQTVTDILPRIRALKDMQTDQLDEEMDSLKEALLANPAAVQLMLPEDVGQLVIALRKITGQALVSAAAPKKKAPKLDKVKSFTKEELLDLADDL